MIWKQHIFAVLPFLILVGLAYCGASVDAARAADKGSRIAQIPFQLTANKPFVCVRINKSAPLWFILDAGSRSASVIDRQRALQLGLNLERERTVHDGAGEGVAVKIAWSR